VTQAEPKADPADGNRPGWRDTIEGDPLGLATRKQWEEDEGPPRSRSTQRRDLLRLIAVVAAVILLGYVAGYGETVLLVVALIGCIVAHEFGHYLAARTGNVKVTEFFVGFGPRLWSIRRGETEYGVKGIPLGGYCRIIGMNNLEEVDPADEARTYRSAPLWRRLLIDVAGSSAHFIIALLVLFAMFFWTGDEGYYLANIPANNPIAQILAFSTGESPAETAGFHIGDRIESINGQHFPSWTAMGRYIQDHTGDRLDVVVDRGGQVLHLFPVPVDANKVHVQGDKAAPSGSVGFIGIGVSGLIHSGFGASLSQAGGAFVQAGASALHTLANRFSIAGAHSLFHELANKKAADNPTSPRLVSPVGVVRILHQAGQSGLPSVLWILALINIFIGIFNLLPIFPLDGGRVVVALYEGVRSWRRPYRVDMAKLLPVLYVGLALILFLGASALFLDLRDLVA
jgi:membrane-associated protease RseP (regulator of RpoE activity)